MKHTIIASSIASCLLIVGVTTPLSAAAVDKEVQATDLVDIFEKLGGKHPGYRKAHAKGMCAAGTFVPSTNEHFKDAALLSNGELPVSMRFSLGGANPNSDERAPGTRGLGMQILRCRQTLCGINRLKHRPHLQIPHFLVFTPFILITRTAKKPNFVGIFSQV